jgi:hypothetical protein
MDYIVKAAFMAEGKQYPRGTVIKGKVVAGWLNAQALEEQGYLRRIESSKE